MAKLLSIAALTTLMAVLLPGCNQPEATTPAAPIAKTPAPKQPAPKPEQSVDATAALREAMVAYVAPFPQRGELFVPPKDAPKSSKSRADGDVQLRGLVDVGELQAILDIEGATALVAVGREKYGVRVVSIENRQVVLQRGSTRWTASID